MKSQTHPTDFWCQHWGYALCLCIFFFAGWGHAQATEDTLPQPAPDVFEKHDDRGSADSHSDLLQKAGAEKNDLPAAEAKPNDGKATQSSPDNATSGEEGNTEKATTGLKDLVEVNRAAREQAEEAARQAEVDRRQTLAAAERAGDEIQSRLLNRLAEAKSIRVELSTARALLFRETERDLQAVRRAIDRTSGNSTALQALPAQSDETNAAFLRASQEESEALDWVVSALGRTEAFAPAQDSLRAFEKALRDERLAISSLLRPADLQSVRGTLEKLEREDAQLRADATKLKEEAAYRFFVLASQRFEVAKLHHEQRIFLLPHLGGQLAVQLRGFHERALEQAKLITRFHWTAFSLHVQRRYFDVLRLPEWKDGFFGWGAVFGHWFMAFLITWLGAWGWRRIPSMYRRVQQLFVGKSKTAGRARIWESIFRWASLFAPRGFLLLYVQILFNELKDISPRPELDLVANTTQWAIGYLLATEILFKAVLRIAEREHLLDEELKGRVLQTLRRLLRYAMTIAWANQLALKFLSEDLALGLAQNLFVVGGVWVVVSVLRGWRTDIAHAYVTGWPQTRLADSVRSADAHWYGFFVSITAFSFVAGKAIYGVGKDFVFGFDHTRKALAYIFRLQIERSARERPPRKFDVAVLPESVIEMFAEDESASVRNFSAGWLVNEFPQLSTVASALIHGKPSAGVLWLHGAYGMGRSTWLRKLQEEVSSHRRCHLLAPHARMYTKEQLLTWLGDQLALGQLQSPKDFAQAFSERPSTLIMIDGLEWFFLRGIGGYGALDTLLEIVRETRGQVDWAWSVPQPAHQHLMYAKRMFELVGTSVHLKPWSEARIRELIRIRQNAAGYPVSFEDLLIRETERNEMSAQVVKNEEQYIRLLWNFAQGNPRTAQHFWLRSLVADDDGALHVNLYDVPSVEELERLPESDRFVLMTLVLHRSLTVAEAARASALDARHVESHLQRGLAMGLYKMSSDGVPSYTIETHYWEAVRRFLQRKNLL